MTFRALARAFLRATSFLLLMGLPVTTEATEAAKATKAKRPRA